MIYHPASAYNTLPLLPPETDLENKAILKKAISASRALAELKGAVTNPNLFIDTITLQEARASLAIEHRVVPLGEAFKAAASGSKIEDPATRDVLRYRDALYHGIAHPSLTTDLFVSIVQIIDPRQPGIRNTGTRLTDPRTERTIYTPPREERLVREKLKNLEDFMRAGGRIDPLIKMAVAHYQFLAIYPFFDGNRRTGRIIPLLYLIREGLLDYPTLYLSDYILQHKEGYYLGLKRVIERRDWTGWILYVLDMVEQTALKTRRQIADVERLMTQMDGEIRQTGLYAPELMEALFKRPYTRRAHLENAGLGTLKTVGNYLKELESAGFLKSEQAGREKLYLNHRLLKCLTTFPS